MNSHREHYVALAVPVLPVISMSSRWPQTINTAQKIHTSRYTVRKNNGAIRMKQSVIHSTVIA